MSVSGTIQVVVKISELPSVQTVADGLKRFHVTCDLLTVQVTVKPKLWKKLENAQLNHPMWIAEISGRVGDYLVHQEGFCMAEPNIEIFGIKPKESAK
ncbi:hypothetical protein [Phormidesmis sp. 146-33]